MQNTLGVLYWALQDVGQRYGRNVSPVNGATSVADDADATDTTDVTAVTAVTDVAIIVAFMGVVGVRLDILCML